MKKNLVPVVLTLLLISTSMPLMADLDSRTRSFDRRKKSLIKTKPAQKVAETKIVEKTEETEVLEVVRTGRRVPVQPEDAAAVKALQPGATARISNKTMRLQQPGTPVEETTTVRKIVTTKTIKAVEEIFKPLSLGIELESDLTFDSNAKAASDAENDWIFNQSIGLEAEYVPSKDSPWTFVAGGGYSLSRYNRFSSEDVDVFDAGVGVSYEVIKDKLVVSIGNSVEWFYGNRFEESLFTRNLLNAGFEYTTECWGGDIVVESSVSRRWYDTGIDRTVYSGSVTYKRTNQKDDQKSGYWKCAIGAGLTYFDYDNGREALEFTPEFEFVYQATEKVALKLKTNYTDAQDSTPDGDYGQFTICPVLQISIDL